MTINANFSMRKPKVKELDSDNREKEKTVDSKNIVGIFQHVISHLKSRVFSFQNKATDHGPTVCG